MNKKILFIITFCVILIFSLNYKSISNAKDDTGIVYYKYFHNYTVQAGDTLWNLAKEYNNDDNYKNYIKEVKSINHLNSDKIKSGEKIVIPYYLTYLK